MHDGDVETKKRLVKKKAFRVSLAFSWFIMTMS